jgi:hypothetical protein
MPALKKKPGPKRKASPRRAGLRPEAKELERVVARKKSGAVVTAKGPTTAENLEKRFDRGDSVLDYFDLTAGGMRYPV